MEDWITDEDRTTNPFLSKTGARPNCPKCGQGMRPLFTSYSCDSCREDAKPGLPAPLAYLYGYTPLIGITNFSPGEVLTDDREAVLEAFNQPYSFVVYQVLGSQTQDLKGSMLYPSLTPAEKQGIPAHWNHKVGDGYMPCIRPITALEEII